jgi:isopentenyl-diphosphate delta-isomerase
MALNARNVSFENEKLILVDEGDNIIGYKRKDECHQGEGILHRAFSIFIFNDKQQLLLQKRSKNKRLWPLYWANTCCSHPRHGEDLETATQRRLKEELGISTCLKFIYKFKYHAKFGKVGSEKEYCSVFIGKSNEAFTANENEIADIRFINLDELTSEIIEHTEEFSPWLKIEWERINSYHMHDIKTL